MFARNVLERINCLRSQYGHPTVDHQLRPIKVDTKVKTEKPKLDHSFAITVYEEYLRFTETLSVYQDYARLICKATDGVGMTPVMPLATMGKNGGALLCDHCRKPLILEGGAYNRVPVDTAWARNPERGPQWKSYISGGCVFHIESNGTVRVYHGHPNNPRECYEVHREKEAQREREFKIDVPKGLFAKLTAYLTEQNPTWSEYEVNKEVNKVINTLYNYDPGLGINQP
jgi:hypothetical protein